ncbi:hypothetical protein L2E82_39654 [Cichorium intybus]|uniref:Uncharacterized protein n=1 Tax=Cichorium intybus TaxID=13427 RepID=A0ACB9AK61_CICIN|nr:hypothetical protein L2E82_39654 [Cichorium intybus]
MENKSLNIFNSKFVLASPETATNADYAAILGVIGHRATPLPFSFFNRDSHVFCPSVHTSVVKRACALVCEPKQPWKPLGNLVDDQTYFH